MTDVQLYLVICVPTLTVFAGILINVVQYNATSVRFIHLESRLVGFGNRIGGVDSNLGALIRKLIDLDNRLAGIEAKLGIG